MKFRIKEKVFSLHGEYKIYDEYDNVCYSVRQNAISVTNKTFIYDASGREVAFIHRKVVSMHDTHFIEMADGASTQFNEKKYLQLHDNYEAEEFGWHVSGNITGHEFTITDNGGRMIAEAKESWISIGDMLMVEVYEQNDVEKVIAILVAISLIQRDRKAAMSTSDSD